MRQHEQQAETYSRKDDHSSASRSKRLSRREATVFALLTSGRAPKEIALELGVAHSTVRTHARNAYQKLGVTNLREAFALLRKD